MLSNSTQNLPNGEVWLAAFRTPSIIPVYDENSTLKPYPTKYASPAQVGLSEFYYNPVAQSEYYDLKPVIACNAFFFMLNQISCLRINCSLKPLIAKILISSRREHIRPNIW